MKIALITGVTGQDGSYLAELLIEKGYYVIGTHRHLQVKTNYFEDIYFKNLLNIITHKNFVLEYGDMLDTSFIWKIIHHYKPNEIYNLAAQSHVNLSFESSEITAQTNALAPLYLLNTILELCPKVKFFQASSSDMFGSNSAHKLNEKHCFIPNTPYGCSKLFAHNIVNTYREKYNLHASSGICFNHESSRRGDNFATKKIAKSIAKIKLGLQDKLYLGNLDIRRDWGHAKDTVRAMWTILQQEIADDYVIATGEANSLQSFVDIIFSYANLDKEKYVVIDKSLYRSYEKKTITGDPSKINLKLDWKHSVSFEELAVEMYRNELNALKTK